MTTNTDKASDKLVEMLRASGAEEAVEGLFYVTAEKAAAFRAAIIADLCGDVEPVAWSVTCDGEHVNNVLTSVIEAERFKRRLDRDYPDYERMLVPLVPAPAFAALKAEIEALRKDAERYRWLRDGEIVADYPYPVMRMGGSRVDDQTIWADELDAAIDAAITARGKT